MGISEVEAAPMLYYYDKYTAVQPAGYLGTSIIQSWGPIYPGEIYEGYSNFNYNDKNATYSCFSVGGEYIRTGYSYSGEPRSVILYSQNSDMLEFAQSFNPNAYAVIIRTTISGNSFSVDIIPAVRNTTGFYRKDALFQTKITALDGTYPNNGRHTDGYWYVKGGLANAEPTLGITQPSSNSPLQGRQAHRKGAV